MKGRLMVVAGLALGLGTVGLLVSASGLIPIKASAGHWRITEWFLHFSMQRSATTHSLGLDVPPLDEPGMILHGALHYEFGCRSCHGAPGAPPAHVSQLMLPPPADLAVAATKSDPKRLFHLVKHGVKFTGMPAFPSQERDDEVWAVVAFLRKLPELDAAGYEQLTRGGLPSEKPAAAPVEPNDAFTRANRSCQQCHGADGHGRGDRIPWVAGQRPEYLQHALESYVNGTRPSGIMKPAVASLEEATLRQLVDHYARLPAKPAGGSNDAAVSADVIDHGRRIAHEGIRERRVPICIECHGPTSRRTNPAYPALAGQPAPYLVRQLELFKGGQRGGSPYAHLMNPVGAGLDPAEMEAVARYFESLTHSPAENPGR